MATPAVLQLDSTTWFLYGFDRDEPIRKPKPIFRHQCSIKFMRVRGKPFRQDDTKQKSFGCALLKVERTSSSRFNPAALAIDGRGGAMNQSTEEWDDLWLKYHGINQKKVEGYFRIFDFYKNDPGTKILDVGCGSGEALKMLKQRGFTHLRGIEPEVKLFQQNNPDNMIQQGNCLEMSNVGGSYDAILMFSVLHHLHTFEEMQQCLQNILRTLVPGGCFYSVEQWRNLVRSIAMKLVRDTPVGKLHPMLRIERELLRLKRKELDHWLGIEEKVTAYAQEIGLNIAFYKKDLRYRYIIFKKALP